MADELVALRLAPRQLGGWLQRVWDAGDAVLPLDPAASEVEVRRLVHRLRPARLISADGSGWRDEPLDAPGPVGEETALVIATSGSTGRPKGVELSHAALRASTDASVRRLGCRPGEAWLGCLPTHHVAGVQTLLRSWALDAEPVVHDRFDVGEVARADAAHVSLVPTQLARLLEARVDVSRFVTVLLGGARPPDGLLDRARRAGAQVVVSYGMSETCGGCVYDGRPLDGVEVRVATDGRIAIRGPVLFSGYRGDPAATAAALDGQGWFTSNDVGRWASGRLEVLGRADDVAISGGENVPLEAVALALRSHPGVSDAAATARRDAEWGQVVVAVVVPRDATDPPTLSELRAHVRERHPAAFAPRRVVPVTEIPRDGLGKVPRAAIDALVDAG